jgi:hypothetical protein
MKGGPATGPSPVDRGKTGGDRNDVTQLIPLIEVIPPIRGKRGQPLRRPKHLYADRGYDREHGSGLGVYRWVGEGALALLHWFRRLRIRWEIRDDIHDAFVTLGCAIICWRRLRNYSICEES